MPTRLLRCLAIAACALSAPVATGAAATADHNAAALLAARAFVVEATRQYGAAVGIEVAAPAAGTNLGPCFRHEIFVPPGARLWGKSRVGVRCSAPASWTAYLPVTVSVSGHYLISARKINRGQLLTESDLELRQGDLTQLPDSTLTELRAALGRRAKVGLAGQQPLRREHLLQSPVIRQGDKVRVLARGEGFVAVSEGVALNHAGEGEAVKVRTGAGKTLSGVARAAGEVELAP